MNDGSQHAAGPASAAPGAADRVALGLLGACCAAACAVLWGHWTGNPDLSHGLLMPVVFIYLIHEARTRGRPRHPAASVPSTAARVLLGAGATLFTLASGLYAAALGWAHPLAASLCAAALSCLLLLGLGHFSRPSLRWVPLNWQALCAALLWPLCAPLPPGAYGRLSGALQQGISEAVLHCLGLLGIPATRHGNIIELASSRVGVEEACSGVRSLVACVFAALLISALLLRSPWKRLLLLLCAPVLAVLMNLARSLVLTLLANAGVDIEGAWHDSTGFAVLALTALLLFGLARLLEGGQQPSPPPPEASAQAATSEPKGSGQLQAWLLLLPSGLCASLALVLATLTLLPRAPVGPPPPVLAQALPASVEHWDCRTAQGLERFAGILGTEDLLERSYSQGLGADRIEVTLYVAAWKAGSATPAEVSLHTPEVCWPGAGWTALPPPPAMTNQGRALRFRSPEGATHELIYWHLYGGVQVPNLDPYAPADLLRMALHYGFRPPATQLFVRVSGNRPLPELLGQPPVRQALQNLGISGL